MLFCVAGAALCDIPTCLITPRKSFCVARAILLRPFHKMSCSFRGTRRNFGDLCRHFAWHFRCVALRALHFTLYTPPFTLHTPHFTLHTLPFTLYTLHPTLRTLHSTLYSSHSTLYTPLFTLDTLHSTL